MKIDEKRSKCLYLAHVRKHGKGKGIKRKRNSAGNSFLIPLSTLSATQRVAHSFRLIFRDRIQNRNLCVQIEN